jgi:hypothetical protein
VDPIREKPRGKGILASLDGAKPAAAQRTPLPARLRALWQPYRKRLALRRSRIVLLLVAAALPAIFWMARGPGKPSVRHDPVFAVAPSLAPVPDGEAEQLSAAIVNEALAEPAPPALSREAAALKANPRPLARKPVPRRVTRESPPPDSDVALLAALVAHDNAAAAALNKAVPKEGQPCGHPRGERTRACACAQNDASCLPQ